MRATGPDFESVRRSTIREKPVYVADNRCSIFPRTANDLERKISTRQLPSGGIILKILEFERIYIVGCLFSTRRTKRVKRVSNDCFFLNEQFVTETGGQSFLKFCGLQSYRLDRVTGNALRLVSAGICIFCYY